MAFVPSSREWKLAFLELEELAFLERDNFEIYGHDIFFRPRK